MVVGFNCTGFSHLDLCFCVCLDGNTTSSDTFVLTLFLCAHNYTNLLLPSLFSLSSLFLPAPPHPHSSSILLFLGAISLPLSGIEIYTCR